MGYEGLDFDSIEGVSPSFVEALYARYRTDPDAIEPGWRTYFDGLEQAVTGPSWARPNWPPTDTDATTAGFDPTQSGLPPKPGKPRANGAVALAEAPSAAVIAKAAEDSIRAQLLIRTYRVRGHLAANLDPLGLSRQKLPADLTPEFHGFTARDMDRPIYVGGALGFETATVREILDVLRKNYCGSVGLEYMHIGDPEERSFLQGRLEGRDKAISFTPEGKKAILTKVIHAEQWEKFLGRKYVGTKRFGLDGGESMIPALESVIKYGGHAGVREVVIGMSHRGRLNVLANVMAKPYRAILSEFAGGSANPEDVGGSGDVKYHLGTSTDREFDGNVIHLSLAPNPSHLEAVDPVVLGKARAKQTKLDDVKREKVLPILLHGDAAFAGQGIIMECFGFSGISGYNTGGTVHFVVNNQVGFTTSPQFARSSPYPVGHRQNGAGADPACERRRSRSRHLRLQGRDRIPPDVQARRRHRHVVLSPLRPQRGRRTGLHPAPDVRCDPQASADLRRLCRAAEGRGRGRREWRRRDHRELRQDARRRVRRRQGLPRQQGGLVSRATGAVSPPRARRCRAAARSTAGSAGSGSARSPTR